MQAVKTIRSRTVVMATTDIDTDQIIPARFLTTTSREGLGQFLFNDLRRHADGRDRPDFVLNSAAARDCHVLVAGNNFGCGSSREHAPWALLDYGLKAVISTEIADIFRNNALKNGFIPVVVDRKTHDYLLANPGVDVTIDIEQETLTIGDDRVIEFPIDGFSRFCLLNGIDQLGYIRQQASAIERFEENRPWRP
ncbi:MAG TPA: 3-isopropylmalate dehydratase small subunit [Woeseiaceae bacterium]|nr:3-isopropylmalate dehydratase small subunit [Woeseiaceae bacterium]